MHTMKEMRGNDVIHIYNLLENNDIKTHIDGGWGIDALLGKQTRTHADLDIAVQHKNIRKLRELLGARGYKEVERADAKDYNFVLRDVHGHEIDVHSYTFDSKGNNVYGIAYPVYYGVVFFLVPPKNVSQAQGVSQDGSPCVHTSNAEPDRTPCHVSSTLRRR